VLHPKLVRSRFHASAQVATFASVALYTSFYVGEAKLATGTLYAVVGLLAAVWALSFGALLLTMERKYVLTFFSAQTGCERIMNHFLDNADNEELRAEIFTNNEESWRPIRAEVQAWVRSRFQSWKQEKPAWFTPAVCASIPTDLLPPCDARRLSRQAGGQRTTIHNASLAQRMSLWAGVQAALPVTQRGSRRVAPTGLGAADSDAEAPGSESSDSEAETQQPPEVDTVTGSGPELGASSCF
jgi:hypothetical protein